MTGLESRSYMPTISVILPTYNRARLLHRSISSVLKQTYADFELIIVDDASTDETRGVVNTFRDARIRYIRHERNLGAAAARNTGLLAARGSYVAFQDSDDEWLSEKLDGQLKLLADSSEDTAMVYTRYRLLREDGTTSTCPSRLQHGLRRLPLRLYALDGDLYLALARGNFITTQSVLIKRKCLDQVGKFDERLPRFQDWDLWLRLAQRYKFAYISEVLVNVYATEGSLSTDVDGFWKALKIILDKHKDQGRVGRVVRAHYQFATGDMIFQQGDDDEGKKRLWAAVRLSPCNVSYWQMALSSLLGREFYLGVVERLNIGYMVR